MQPSNGSRLPWQPTLSVNMPTLSVNSRYTKGAGAPSDRTVRVGRKQHSLRALVQYWLLRRQTLHQRPKVTQSFASRRTDGVVAFLWVIYPWDTRYRRTTKQPRCLLFRLYIVLGEPSQTALSTHGAQHSVVSTVGKHYKPRSSYQRIATEPIRRLLPWHFIMFRVRNRPALPLLSAGALWEASGSLGSRLRRFSRS